MGILLTDSHKTEIQGVRSILFARPDQIDDATIMSDPYIKFAELSLIKDLCACPGYSTSDLKTLREQIDRTQLPEDDANYVSPEDYENVFGVNYDDDYNKYCLLILALQYKLATIISERKPQIVSARVLGAQYSYSTRQNEQSATNFDDDYNDLIQQLCPGSGTATASVLVADPWIGF